MIYRISELFPEVSSMSCTRYSELMEELCQLGKNVFKSDVLPLEIAVPKRVKAFVENKYMDAGVQGGGFLVFHGIKSDSSACMTSKGDLDSLLHPKQWSKLAKSTRYVHIVGIKCRLASVLQMNYSFLSPVCPWHILSC